MKPWHSFYRIAQSIASLHIDTISIGNFENKNPWYDKNKDLTAAIFSISMQYTS